MAPTGPLLSIANPAVLRVGRTGTRAGTDPEPDDDDDDLELPLRSLAPNRPARQPSHSPERMEERRERVGQRVRRPSQRAMEANHLNLDHDEIMLDEELPELEDATSDDESDGEDTLIRVGRRGGGRGARGGRGGGRVGRGPPRSPEHGESETHIKRHRLSWLKGGTREIDPMLTGNGYSARSRLTLYNYTSKTPLDFFEHCWPALVEEIAEATSLAGQRIIRPGFQVSKGEMWLYLAEKGYMNIFPQEGPKGHYWEVPEEQKEEMIYVEHDLGRFGHDYSRFKDIERAFRLPTYGNSSDFFDPVRKLVDSWNNCMEAAIEPGPVLTVDESMGGWKGKGMPGLMVVPRKPTPTGREAHTTADAETGVIIHYEMYEGKELMKHKEFVADAGKNPAKAMRCVKPWFGSGRCVILDSGFACVVCALCLRDKGMHMIGNVKTGHKKFPKEWLLSQVPARGDRATCTAIAVSPGGLRVHLLAAADRDKQPMALLGTVGTSLEGQTLFRVFTTIRADGTYNSREATLAQMHIHELYRKYFNALDKHNAYRQGNHNLEQTWKTKRWYVREFQVLWGMSEVNAWLLYRRFVPGSANLSFTDFRKRLIHMMLRHPSWVQESIRLRSHGAQRGSTQHVITKIGVSSSGVELLRVCVMCGKGTRVCCSCTPTDNLPGVPICNPSGKRPECHAKHIDNVKPPNRRSEAVTKIWKRKREERM